MIKKKILFLDRDGVILQEPPTDYQIDSFEKTSFVPGAITTLSKIAASGEYEFVMITNQDGLGSESFPEDTFWGPHNLMVRTLEGEGIHFREIFIDRTYAHEGKDTRKPGIGLLRHYTLGDFDMANSLVIGDRLTDMMLAQNLGCKGIMIGKSVDEADDHLADNIDLADTILLKSDSWTEIGRYILNRDRLVQHRRKTKETCIDIALNLDGPAHADIKTGLSFFDHMLDQLAIHGGLDLTIKCEGDLHIDEHHTIEDVALALGECFRKALGNKRGIRRYGFPLPMDEATANVLIDFGGRPYLVFNGDFKREYVGDFPTEMTSHFFKSFSDASLSNIQISVEGENDHHKIEATFKAFARAIKMAIERAQSATDIPTTKGTI